jgi:hypothetical protein
LAWEKLTLFLRAIDKRFRKELQLLLEDPGTEDGITNVWATVTNSCNKLTKRKQRSSEAQTTNGSEYKYAQELEIHRTRKDEAGEIKMLSTSADTKTKTLLEDLTKSMKDLSIKVAKLESGQTVKGKESFRPRCMWCDKFDHRIRECAEFKDIETKELVYWKNGKMYLTETNMPLERNLVKVVSNQDLKRQKQRMFSQCITRHFFDYN